MVTNDVGPASSLQGRLSSNEAETAESNSAALMKTTPLELQQPADRTPSSEMRAKSKQPPTFFPPLWLARRTACIKALRKHGVRSVVDVGCGEGAVLSMLISPAYHLDTFPDLYAPDPVPHSIGSSTLSSAREHKLEQLRKVPRLEPEEDELHLRRVIGVDVDRKSLQKANEATDPKWLGTGGAYELERWEEMRVELYEGGLETYNPAFEGVEAMIATEVIEHLPPQLFDKFASTILGVYQPRLVVVTTPNHEFNPYFVATSEQDEANNRFPDPSQRTKRIFRNDDHQFEFTIDEFQSWANSVAAEHDYDVSFSGVGSLSHYYKARPPYSSSIPFPPPCLLAHPACSDFASSKSLPANPTSFYATQIATFTRIIRNEVERSPRSNKPQPLPFFSPSPTIETQPFSVRDVTSRPSMSPRKSTMTTPHCLLSTHTHSAHPSASEPATPREILDSLRATHLERHLARLPLSVIWSTAKIRLECAGKVSNLIDALLDIDDDGEWEFEALNVTQNGAEEEEHRAMDALVLHWTRFNEAVEQHQATNGLNGDGDQKERSGWDDSPLDEDGDDDFEGSDLEHEWEME